MKDCGCNINDDGIDTDILFELPQNVFDLIGKKIGLKSGTKYDNDVKNKLKEDAKLNNKNLKEYLTEIPDVSKQIMIIEMKKGGILKHQMGGLSSMGNITTGNHNMNRLGQMMMVNNLYKPEMQQGGKLDQKAFIKWLASKLGVNSKEEFESAVKQMGEEGLKQAQQMFAKESQGTMMAQNGAVMVNPKEEYLKQNPDRLPAIKSNANRYYSEQLNQFEKNKQAGSLNQYLNRPNYEQTLKDDVYKRYGVRFKQGGILKYQQGGFKPFAKQEARLAKTDSKSYRYIPGTYDSNEQSANTYNNIQSNPDYNAIGSQGQSKINYEQGVGQRTQLGLMGNRGDEGVNMTDRLAKERQELQSNWDKLATDKDFQSKRLIKGKDGKTYVTDTTGKYNLGMYEEKSNDIPVENNRNYVIGVQPKAVGSAQYPEFFDVINGKKERVTAYDRKIKQTNDDVLTQFGGKYDKNTKTVQFKDKTYKADSIPVLFDEKTKRVIGIR